MDKYNPSLQSQNRPLSYWGYKSTVREEMHGQSHLFKGEESPIPGWVKVKMEENWLI